MEPRNGLPSFWCTHLAKVLVGEQPCLLQPWLGSRYTFPDRGDAGALANWKADHSALLQGIVKDRRDEGWKCDVERFFRVSGQHAVVSGKADLITQKADCRPVVIDAKSGAPKDADVAQVMIEMLLIPLAWRKDITFEGKVVYAASESVIVSPRYAEQFRPKLFAMVKDLATMARPEPSPSRDACRFCNVPDTECGQRWKEENDSVATTQEF